MSLADYAERADGFEGIEAKVGWFESAKYPDGTPVATVAMIHEFGAPGANIPARPFMRPTIADKGPEWNENIAKGIRAVLAGRTTADNVLTQVGMQAAGHIRQAISQVRSPALAASTIAQRERNGRTDQPLHDTGLMIATLTSIVGEVEE